MIDTEMSNYIHLSKYSRWIPEKKRRETWEETVERLISFWRKRWGHVISEEVFEEIKADKARLTGAQEAAKRMLVEEQERNRGLAKVANGTATRQQSRVGGTTITNRSTSKSGVVDLLKGVK